MLRKFVSHSLIYGMANQVPKIAGVFILPFITKDLTENDYGIYGIVLAYSSSIEILATLGLRVSLLNSFYKAGKRFRVFWSQLYGFLLTWMIPYLLLHFTIIYAALPAISTNRVLISILSASSGFFFGPVSLIGALYFQLNERPMRVAVISSATGLMTVGLNCWFIAVLKMGHLGWFWSSALTGVAVALAYLLILNYEIVLKPVWLFNPRYIKASLKVSLPTIPHFYSVFLLNSSDRVLMNQMNIPEENIGRYNIAYTVGNIFQSIAMATGFAITPLMMRSYKNKDELTARKLVFFLQGVFLLVTFLSCLWMKELFAVLIRNNQLSRMYYLGIIIVMSFNYRPIYYGAVNKLIYLEKTTILWKLSFIPGLLNVVLNLFGIPIWGYEFAAYSTFGSFTMMGLLGYFMEDFKNNNTVPYYPILWMIMNAVLTIIAYSLKESAWEIRLALSCISFVIASGLLIRLLTIGNKAHS